MHTLREGICKEARETKDSVSIVSEPLFFLILFSGNTVNNATCEISKKKKKKKHIHKKQHKNKREYKRANQFFEMLEIVKIPIVDSCPK